jgi:D-inositol-3-phosphate glycosyltransferase
VEAGVSGILVDGHGIDLWTTELDRLLGDEDALAAMGAAAHRHAQGFSWDHTADQLLASYGKAIDTFRRNHPMAPAAPATASRISGAPETLPEETTPNGVAVEPEARSLSRMARRFAGRRNGART